MNIDNSLYGLKPCHLTEKEIENYLKQSLNKGFLNYDITDTFNYELMVYAELQFPLNLQIQSYIKEIKQKINYYFQTKEKILNLSGYYTNSI